ncbi:MAG: Mur ligase family protein, partial [Coriobacteriaceae bacterium]|nr:Mur ligase family protein [Coriobacteriaceae bacterium]
MKFGAWEIRFCDVTNIPAILELQEVVFEALGDDADLLRRNTRETFIRCLDAPNFTLGVFDGDTLIALSIMEDARGRDDDLGIQIKNHTLEDYADYKLTLVHPAYRGHGLQRTLVAMIEEIAFWRGYRWLCVSVSPENVHSRNNIIASGFTLDCTAELYGGLKREIYVKELSAADASSFEGIAPAPVARIADVLRGKRVLVWGHGMEGRSAEAFINQRCSAASLDVYEGAQDGIDEDAYDVIIKSPGIRESWWNDKYTSVTELFMGEFAHQTIGITGTKGKSTTASLLARVLAEGQKRPVVLVGNIGIACLDAYDRITPDTIVVFELSCHQLDHLRRSPHVGVFLNLYEEHLDHYDTLERYFEAK